MSSPGILRQYLQDYEDAARQYSYKAIPYDNSVPKDENGDPLLYYVDRYRKSSTGSKRTYYHQMHKNENGEWEASSHGSKHSPGSLVTAPGQTDHHIKMRQDPTPQYDEHGNIIGYEYREHPGEFTAKVPTFTVAQTKKLTLPASGRGISQTVRSDEGIIGRFLGRKDQESGNRLY
ncbi:MAG: hypothetical protein LBR95_09225 [Azoarcus sp.]|jgi:hypothetical protein|nr:hypothetical protein [Azoarcus sp.]